MTELAMILDTGERITAPTLPQLAERWLLAVYGPIRWHALTPDQQAEELSDAIQDLSQAYDAATREN